MLDTNDLAIAQGKAMKDLKPSFPFEVAGITHWHGACWCSPVLVYDLDSDHKPIVDQETGAVVCHWVHTNDRAN